MIGARQIAMMKPDAYLINTSRGDVIDEAALAQALREERLAGAALDVFEEEPLPKESPLRSVDPARLILTPHAIGSSLAARDAGYRMAIESIIALLDGNPPPSVLNPEAAPRWRERTRGSTPERTN